MVDFTNLKKAEAPGDRSVRFTFMDLEGAPFLNVRLAGEANKPFFNELIRRTKAAAKAVNAGAVNTELVAKNRNEDRVLYSKYIVTGWGNVVDAEGKTVAFSSENALDFLNQLPDWLFDKLRTFCSTIENFVDQAPIDAEGAGKNS